MFTISLRHFRCWEGLDLNIPLGKITLIRGASGSGKTTIFQAITWCLYGNIRLVAPNNSEKAATQVIISFPYNHLGCDGILTIDRQKGTDNITVTHSGQIVKTYTDKEAKQMIIDLFGTYDIWVASCYIGQGCRNNFLTSTNAGKMDFLNNIAFHVEDPSDFVDKISSSIDEQNAICTVKTKSLQDEANRIELLLKNIDITKALNSEQIDTLVSTLNTNNNRLMELQQIKSQRSIDKGMLNNLEAQLSQVNTTHIRVPVPDSLLTSLNQKIDTIESLENLIQKYTNTIPILQRRDDLNNEVTRCENILSRTAKPSNNYTLLDYQDALMKENIYRDQQQLAQTLGVQYNETEVNARIQNCRNNLMSQERLKLEQDIRTRKHFISDSEKNIIQLSNPITIPVLTHNIITEPDYSKYNTTELSNSLQKLSQDKGHVFAQIQQLQRGLDVKQCPGCKIPLKEHQGVLVHADTAPINHSEVAVLQNTLTDINTEINRINTTINSMKTMEHNERIQYDRIKFQEQQRVTLLNEQINKLQMEVQRRDIAIQSHNKDIATFTAELVKCIEEVDKLPPVCGNPQMLSPFQIEQTHSLIARLGTLKFVSLPEIPSKQIQDNLNYYEVISKHQIAKDHYLNHIQEIPIEIRNESVMVLQTYITKLREYLAHMRNAANEEIRLRQLKTSLEQQINTISQRIQEDPVIEIMKLSLEIGNITAMLNMNTKAQEVIKIINKFNEEREKLIELNAELSDLYMFHQHAVETECKTLQQVVDNINDSIKDVCSTLFDEDISIMLSLFKTVKATKNIKPMVNFSISHKGGLYDNITQISGGEGDRASIALTTALNTFSAFPVLMLDESLGSLDSITKETAVETLKSAGTNTILLIMHDGVEGIFDNVIDLDTL